MSNVEFKDNDAAWGHLFHIVRDRYPYSKMRGLNVKGGVVVSFDEAQYTFVPGQGAGPSRPPLPESFDHQWQSFMHFCEELQGGIVGEVTFKDGRPVLVSMQTAGMDLCDAWIAGYQPKEVQLTLGF